MPLPPLPMTSFSAMHQHLRVLARSVCPLFKSTFLLPFTAQLDHICIQIVLTQIYWSHERMCYENASDIPAAYPASSHRTHAPPVDPPFDNHDRAHQPHPLRVPPLHVSSTTHGMRTVLSCMAVKIACIAFFMLPCHSATSAHISWSRPESSNPTPIAVRALFAALSPFLIL
ncbi:hypothetical protein MSAN_01946000 [Mycena sanguinolenta]|uniref:Uncharacterized protein n=1 Tax=Mycena sanguinolenta TaxID=230812 RepID=A0A8H6XN63_9AGAR|nr:hypothetical protein MSAN_01946000 [Mycena sanguinolenta]